ncbi:tyrosine-type recombinase/integrase [Ancylobacter sp. G4_0304]|uniref:tyrosine-type recombinase/integrase n=1 Tax=Ancylobacter sp. G4_0304 TaxID=3114289 RepID=UPI0039C69D8D
MKVLTDKILSESAYTAEIDVPFEKVDIAEWLFSLPEAEYLRCCPPDHIGSGVTTTDDGRRMVINVEMIGTGLVIQHYIAEEARPDYCRMNSISDVFTPVGRTQVNVLWELAWLERRGGSIDDYAFPSRVNHEGHLSTRQYARLVDEWVTAIGLRPEEYGTHSLRRTKAPLIYKATGNLRAIQILLGQTKIENTVRYLGVDIDDALTLAETTEI